MLQQSIDDLVKKTGNRYALTIVASKRARGLIDEYNKKMNVKSERMDSYNELDPTLYNIRKPLTYATEEVLNGEIKMSEEALADILG